MTVSDSTGAAIAASATHLPMNDSQDFDDVERGLIARSDNRQIRATDGRVVWDLDAYAFLDGECPDTVHPSLWRQGQLLIKDGLFEVTPGIYQVRGYDLSVISFLETDSGVVVVDPLISCETAAAAFALYSVHRGERPVVGMIFTHSHADHFGGAKGILTEEQVAGGVPVIAPAGFLEHAVSENIMAGTAMTRRAGYAYGAALEKSPVGQVGAGLGQTTSTGEVSLIPPTVDIERTGQELTIDGLRIEFQLTPGTEAPAELNFYLPDARALCTAENTSHTLHNILTLRGAEVRDARAWADYLTESIALFGDDLELAFASHHWPTWGRERAVEFLSAQRDMYAYLHDQTLRLMNQGYIGSEIAEMIQMPPALDQMWSTHGYYGSVSHNVKAIYQRYMGWYSGNPAHLWQHPPVAAAQRYVSAMGGPDAALGIARKAYADGDYRWAAEVLDRILFDDETNEVAHALQAQTLEQLAFGCENGTWRNVYLAGAYELRNGVFGTPVSTAGLASGLSVEQVFASIAVRIDGPRCWDEHVVVSWVFTDLDRVHVTELRNGVLIQRLTSAPADGSTTLTLTRTALIGIVSGTLDIGAEVEQGAIVVAGDASDVQRLLGAVGPVDENFPIVTPRRP
ncbi:MAG: alkyl sulfatase dimerization domain-containing protein [Actinomycetota bacterium]